VLPRSLVRLYRTVSPSPLAHPEGRVSQAVCSLLHLSSRPTGRSRRFGRARPLAGSLLYGVRTFLSLPAGCHDQQAATVPSAPKVTKGGNRKVSSEDWRRRRDSNPRYSFPYTAFPMLRLQPLGHPSDNEPRRQSGTHQDFRVSTHRPFQNAVAKTQWPNPLAGFHRP
jgi:hypothetical protein